MESGAGCRRQFWNWLPRTVCSPPTDSQHLLLILDGSLTLDILLRDLHHEYALVTLDGALCTQLERLSEAVVSVFFG